MAGAEARALRHRLLALGLVLVAGLGPACAARRSPRDLPPQTVTDPAPQGGSSAPVAPVPEPSETAAHRPETASAADSPQRPGATSQATGSPVTTIVVEEGGGAVGPGTLAEASRAERERRSQAGPPVAVITSKNLKDYSKGRVTTGPPPREPSAVGDAAARDETAREFYWRERLTQLRREWRQAHDALPDREREAAALRVKFYAADDPYLRDAQIKPAWDHALEQVRAARRDIERLQAAVAIALEEGRAAGAEPAWLRAGVELEPPPLAEAEAASRPILGEPRPGAEPGEPDVIDEPPGP